MKTLLVVWTITGVLSQVYAQAQQFVSHSHPHSTSTTTSQDSDAARLNCLPLWGEKKKPSSMKKREEDFLKSCDESFSTRAEASQFFAERGWEYIAEGELDTACYRFNLAHLLNTKSSDPYWGLGVVCYQKGQVPEAIRMLRKGVSIDSTNTILLDDLATLYVQQYQTSQQASDLDEAFVLLDKSVKLDTTNATTFFKLSLAEYHRNAFEKAWDYLHKSRQLDVQVLDFNFIQQLVAKKEDPMGIFKASN